MPRQTPAAESAETKPATQKKAPEKKTEPEKPAERPAQTQTTARVTEGQVPQLERLVPNKITDADLAKLNVYQRWARVIDEIGLVPKRGWNDHHKYSFTLDADLNAFLGPLFAKYHLVVIPTVLLDRVERIEPAPGAKQWLTRLPMHIKVINGDKPDDFFELDWLGEGADTVDKGVYKAYTGGLKFFYMKMLQVATGDDPELFTKTDEIGDLQARAAAAAGPPREARPVTVRPSNARQPEKGGHQTEVTNVQLRQVKIMSRAMGYGPRGTAETFDRVLNTKIFDTIDGMDSDDEAGEVLATWIRQQTGDDVGKVIQAMSDDLAKREADKPDEQPAPVEDEAQLLADAAVVEEPAQEDLGLGNDS